MSSLEVVILCFNSTNASCVEPPTNKQHKNYNFVQKLQDSWATQFAWVEFKIGDGILVFVKCIVCGVITCQAIHIMFKRDNLGKHMGKQKMSHEIYYSKDNKHALKSCLVQCWVTIVYFAKSW